VAVQGGVGRHPSRGGRGGNNGVYDSGQNPERIRGGGQSHPGEGGRRGGAPPAPRPDPAGARRATAGGALPKQAGQDMPRANDGPFTETKELIAGYTVIQVKSREEALEWAKRMPNPHLEGGTIEIRQMYELEDFAAGDAIDRFRRLGIASEK